MEDRVDKTKEEWKNELTPEQFHVCRQKGTEPAFSGDYWETKTPGTYVCVCCGQELFDSNTKFDSGTGWPSFSAPTSIEGDNSLFMRRTEVPVTLTAMSSTAPRTGQRYCMNSAGPRAHFWAMVGGYLAVTGLAPGQTGNSWRERQRA